MKSRHRLLIKGIVQGVGFRPFIYQLAHAHQLKGWVLNSGQGVILEIEGNEDNIEAFISEISLKAPPRAVIESIETKLLPVVGYTNFEIRESLEKDEKFQLISPDISICDECLKELFDPRNRRYRYPFINCTNCGPRFTIIEDIPYDRPKTTMKKFKMCPDCQAEYDNPMSRRFHAQPNACSVCGPSLEFRSGQNSKSSAQNNGALKQAVKALKAGEIVAIKGLGGFHLACDAENEEAVKKLRVRKKRYGKPLAIMLLDLKQVQKYCYFDEKEKKILTSPQRPIVLLRKRPDITISKEVAPNNNYLGVMLPYTPLHYLLLKDANLPLVMTSGNLSEEPIAAENEEALRRLNHIADHFLLHNRDIYSRYDDPVVRVINGEMVMIRRARSFAPYPIRLLFKVKKQILAVGGELKNTFCLLKDSYAFISQHIGDLENLETLEHFGNTLELYKRLFRIQPEIIAHDLHPDYLSTKFAREFDEVKLIGVQHHHAHIVSCMIENSVKDSVIGVAFDGTGYGPDKTVWGGEFLICNWEDFSRVGHLRQVRLPGGEVAIEKPYRTAFSYLYTFFGEEYQKLGISYLNRLDPVEIEVMKKQIEKGFLSPLTSSAGRLFDAVSSLIGIRDKIEFEGQAAIELEMQSDEAINESYEFDLKNSEGLIIVDTEPIIRGVIKDLETGIANSVIGAKFHNTVVEFITEVSERLREKTGINIVALSGGVFQNVFLLRKLKRRLRDGGFKVITQKQIPTNDGGISLGQAVIAHQQVINNKVK